MKKLVALALVCIVSAVCLMILWNVVHVGPSVALIHVHVNNAAEKEITVRIPVKGASFGANKRIIRLDDKDGCNITIPEEDCGLIGINHEFGYLRIITAPGDKIELNITSKTDIVYKGDNAAGHKLFNSLNRQLIQDVENPYENDTIASIIEQKINDKRNEELYRLDALLQAGEIGRFYFDFAKRDIEYYYAASLADAMTSKYYTSKRKNTLLKNDYITTWKRSFQQMPLNSPAAIATENFKYYAGLYYESFSGDFLGEKKLSGIKGNHLANYYIIDKHFTKDVAEYLKAFYIYTRVIQKTYEQSLVDIYQKFTIEYPHSNYIRFIKGDIDSVIAFNKEVQKNSQSNFTIFDGYDKLNSVDELLRSLKGSAYYVDIWSTWCVPCKEEFAYTSALQALLNDKKIKTLYLSIDKSEADKKWRDMINYYKLPGLHVRTNKQLNADLFRRLGKGGQLAIPRYLLIDKDGKIVNDNAERPSDTVRLKHQILSHLL